MFIFMKDPHSSQVATMYFMYHEYKQPRRCQIFLRPQWRGARLWPHDGERCLCKSENKFSPWLVWAMVQWEFVVPAKVIRESNCILYCPRMSDPNWAWVPHPSTHDSVYMSVYESVLFCFFLYALCMSLVCTDCICTNTVRSYIFKHFYFALIMPVYCMHVLYVHVCLGHCVCASAGRYR